MPPGRESDFGSPQASSLDELVSGARRALEPLLDRPIALFGHSLGAIVAYETARSLERDGIEPALLIVSCRNAPHLPSLRAPIAHLTDDAFIAQIAELGGMPDEVLANREFLDLCLPALRGDFRLAESYPAQQRPPLRCPILALGSASDYVGEEAIDAWRAATAGAFTSRIFPGGHFYLNTERRALHECISAALQDALVPWSTGPTLSRP